MYRLYVVLVHLRPAFPLGIHLFSVYATLQDDKTRITFIDEVFEFVTSVDAATCWREFHASRCFLCISKDQFLTSFWKSERIAEALRCMSSTSSPGLREIPVPILKSINVSVLSRLSDLLKKVEETGDWPQWVLQASMINKSSGKTRPQDKRHIAVLEILYDGGGSALAPRTSGSVPDRATMGFQADVDSTPGPAFERPYSPSP